MNAILSAFKQFLKNIWSDYMLAACLFAPIFMGVFFRFALPPLENYLCLYFKREEILSDYYVLFDLLLSLMTPLMLCFSGVMVVLEEIDDGTAKYLMVTPLRKMGYLISRIGLLVVLSIIYNIILIQLFSLSDMKILIVIANAVLNAIISIIIAMLVISFAKNKVEGMALIKLSGFMVLGFLAAFFIKDFKGYLIGVLPSFWIGKMSLDQNVLFIIPALIVSSLWIVLLYRRFNNRMYQ